MTTSLLEAIAGKVATTRAQGPQNAATMKASIVEHLRLLCSTRRGSMLSAPRYGIDDVTLLFHEMPGGMEEIRLQLEETISRYEPRLASARVSHGSTDAHDLLLRFEIRASIIIGGRLIPVRFTAVIDPTRRNVFA